MTWIIYVENTKELTTTKNLLKLINNYDKVGNIRLIDKGQLLSYLPATGLLVFSSTCKEIGSHHSVLTSNKKLNWLKINNFSWIHKEQDTGQITVSKSERQTHEYKNLKCTLLSERRQSEKPSCLFPW